MPFIIPIIAVGAAIAGAVTQAKQEKLQQSGLKDQEGIAGQEAADKQQVFNQEEAFYTPYTKDGSPYLQNIQSAAAGQNAQQTNNAAGMFRQVMGGSGLGYGPSGSTAAGLANIGAGAAANGANNYLANLLNNEQVKFQAASGLNSAGTMAGATQNQPNVSTQLTPASGASAIGALGQVLKGINTGGSNPAAGGTTPNSASTSTDPSVALPGTDGAPTTQGTQV